MSERRHSACSVEVRGMTGAGAVVEGYATTFDSEYEVAGFREVVRPGAAKRTTKQGDIRALFNHDPNFPLGRSKAGTLQLWNDETGWGYRIAMPTNPMAQMVYEAIDRGDVTGSSFSFEVKKEKWNYPKDGDEVRTPLREILEFKAYDVGPVVFPANEATSVDIVRCLRSIASDLHVDIDAHNAFTIPDLLELARAAEPGEDEAEDREATTQDPAVDPPQALDATPAPEPVRIYIPL